MEDTRMVVEESEPVTAGSAFQTLWTRKWLILVTALVSGAVACVTAFILPREYEATVTISPVADDGSSGRGGSLGSMLGSLGGLASVAGLSLNSNEHKAESLAILQSESLTERFIQQRNLLPELFHDKWDAANQRWEPMAPEKVPTLWKGNEFFKKSVRKVTTDVKTGLTTLTITWRNPKTAADWANSLVELGNDTIRGRTIEESERNIAYLNEQLAKSTMVTVQNSISTLLENEIKKVMLARGSREYAFRVLDVAVPPEKASFPNRPAWTIIGLFLGALAASGFALTFPGTAAGGRSAGDELRRPAGSVAGA